MKLIQRNSGIPRFDTLADAVAADLSVDQMVITLGELAKSDKDGKTYVVYASGSGGITMANGNELIEHTGKAVTELDSIAGGIPDLVGNYDGQQVSVIGWHIDSDQGGGTLYWDSAKAKSDHNGGTVFSPTVPFGVTIDYLNAVGEIDPSGSGCWVRGEVSFFSPEGFGAVGDGAVDDIEAINASILAASLNGGGMVYTNQPHLITDSILLKSHVNFVHDNTLTTSGMSAYNPEHDAAVLFKGASVSTTTLTVSGTKDAYILPLLDVSGLLVNDMLIVELDSDFGGTSTGAGVESHLCKILSIDALNVTIDNPLPRAFPQADALVRKVDLIEGATARVSRIEGAPYHGFQLWWARSCVASGEVNPIGKNTLYIHRSFGNRMGEGLVGKNPLSTVSPWGYGFLVDYGSADNVISGGYFEDVRECSTGHNARRNTFSLNTIIRPVDNGMNVHGLGENDNVFEANTIVNSQQYGIAIGLLAASGGHAVCKRNVFRGNRLIGTTGYAIRETQFEDPGEECGTIIEGNIISDSLSTSIYISGAEADAPITNTIVRKNRIFNSGYRGIELNSIAVSDCQVEDNTIDGTGSDGIILNSPSGNNVITRNKINNTGSYGIRELQNIDGLNSENRIADNTLRNTGGTAIFLSATGTDRIKTEVSRNKITSAQGIGRGIELTGAGVSACSIDNNNINSTNGDGIIFNSSGEDHHVRNNRLRNIGGIGIRSTVPGTRIVESDNVIDSSVGAPYSGVADRQPTAGNWLKGDIVYNRGAVSAGSPTGWVCIVAGLPGTWEKYGTTAP